MELDPVLREIDRERASLKTRFFLLRHPCHLRQCHPPQCHANARQDLIHTKGLGHIIVGSQIKGFDFRTFGLFD